MEAKIKYLFTNTLLITIGNIGSRFIMFLLLPLYTNILSAVQYGIIELVIIGSNLILPIVSLSVEDAVLRFGLDKKNISGEVLKNACLIISIGTVLLFALSPLVLRYEAISEWATYFIIILVAKMYHTVFSIYLKAIDKIRLFAINSIVYALLIAIFNILFLLVFKWGITGYFLALIYATLLSAVFIALSGGLIKVFLSSKINHMLLKSMVLFSIPMAINAVSWWLNSSSNRILLEYYISLDAVGLYSVAAKMTLLLIAVTGVFNQAWVISSVTEYDSDRDKGFYQRTFSVYNVLLVVFSSVIILIIKPFMSFYVGPEFAQTWTYVPFLLIGAIFLSYSNFFNAIYLAVKKNLFIMLTTLFGAIISITLNVILIPRVGIFGAVISTMITYIFIGLYRMFNSRKYFYFYINYKSTFASIIILMFQSIVVSIQFYPIQLSLVCITMILFINHQVAKELFTKFGSLTLKAITRKADIG